MLRALAAARRLGPARRIGKSGPAPVLSLSPSLSVYRSPHHHHQRAMMTVSTFTPEIEEAHRLACAKGHETYIDPKTRCVGSSMTVIALEPRLSRVPCCVQPLHILGSQGQCRRLL